MGYHDDCLSAGIRGGDIIVSLRTSTGYDVDLRAHNENKVHVQLLRRYHVARYGAGTDLKAVLAEGDSYVIAGHQITVCNIDGNVTSVEVRTEECVPSLVTRRRRNSEMCACRRRASGPSSNGLYSCVGNSIVMAKAPPSDAVGGCRRQLGPSTGVPVRIVNSVSKRALYAAKGLNWGFGVGAGSPPDAVGADGDWLIISEGPRYRVVNRYSMRSLYGSALRKVGAGFPPSDVHNDGLWNITRLDTGLYTIIDSSGGALYARGSDNWDRGFQIVDPPFPPGVDAWSIVTVD